MDCVRASATATAIIVVPVIAAVVVIVADLYSTAFVGCVPRICAREVSPRIAY